MKREMNFKVFFIDVGTYFLFITILGVILVLWKEIYKIGNNFNNTLFLIINTWASIIITITIYHNWLKRLKE